MGSPPPNPYQNPGTYPAYAVPPQPYAGPGPFGAAPVCQICGAGPAAAVTVRGHQGMIVMMRFLRREGVFCRPCGLAIFREMQTNTMMQGWWGPLSAIITPFTLLLNLGARSTLNRLPEPTAWGWRTPLDPGKPVMKRPAGVIALIPMALLGLVVMAIPLLIVLGMVVGDGKPEPISAGSCVRNDGSWSDQDLKTVSCDSSDAEYRVSDPGEGDCPAGDYLSDPEYSKDGLMLCLHPLGG